MKLEVKQLSFKYPSSNQLILDHINLTFQSGETVAIVGQNGAGKTTLVKLMNGLLKTDEGDVLVDNINTKDCTTAQIAKRVGYVFQNPDDQIFNSDILTEISYSPSYFGWTPAKIKEHVRNAVEICELKEHLTSHPYDLPFSMKKFVTIACVLAMDTDVVIFDEPTAGQDQRGIKILTNIIKQLKEKNKIVVIITHDMEFAVNNFDRVVAMANGQVIKDGSREEVFSRNDVLKMANISKPYVTMVGNELQFEKEVLTIPDFVEEAKRFYGEGHAK